MDDDRTDIFKICPCCGEVWSNRDDFIKDTSLYMNGYMADFKTLEKGLFYFTHLIEGCRSTLVVPARHFLDLYSGDRSLDICTGGQECQGYCMDDTCLKRCTAMCEYAFVREVIHIILKKKNQPAEAFHREMVTLPWKVDPS